MKTFKTIKNNFSRLLCAAAAVCACAGLTSCGRGEKEPEYWKQDMTGILPKGYKITPKTGLQKQVYKACIETGRSKYVTAECVKAVDVFENASKVLSPLKSETEKSMKSIGKLMKDVERIRKDYEAIEASDGALEKLDERLAGIKDESKDINLEFEGYSTLSDAVYNSEEYAEDALEGSSGYKKLAKLRANAQKLLEKNEHHVDAVNDGMDNLKSALMEVDELRQTALEKVEKARQIAITKTALDNARKLYDAAMKLSEKSGKADCEDLAAKIKTSQEELAALAQANRNVFMYSGWLSTSFGINNNARNPYQPQLEAKNDDFYVTEPHEVAIYQAVLARHVEDWIPVIDYIERISKSVEFLATCRAELAQLNDQRKAFVAQAEAVEKSAQSGTASMAELDAELAKALEAHKKYEEFKKLVTARCNVLLAITDATRTYNGEKMESAVSLARGAAAHAGSIRNNANAQKILKTKASAMSASADEVRGVYGKVFSAANDFSVERAVKDTNRAVEKARGAAK